MPAIMTQSQQAEPSDDMMLLPVREYEELWAEATIYRNALIVLSQSTSEATRRLAAAALGKRRWG